MKKFLKIFLIAFLSLLSILILTIGIAWWIVFTPERITPIVRKQAEKFITCQSEIDEVELTFYRTYPNFGLKIKQLALINPVSASTGNAADEATADAAYDDPVSAPGDTLIMLEELIAVIDAEAWWKRREYILVGLELRGGSINVFSDSLGNTNYDIFQTDTTTSPEKGKETVMPILEIRKVVLEDVNLHYLDLAAKLNARIRGLDAGISGTIEADKISGMLELSRSEISLEYDGDNYLDEASIQLDIPVDIIPSRQYINLRNARLSVDELELYLNGSIENDTLVQTLTADISYTLSSWQIEDMLALLPPSFHSNLEGIEVDGILTSEGSIKGQVNDSVMPLMDIHLLLENGNLIYDDFPLPLHNVQGDINFYSDLKSDELSYLRINRFNASTPQSNVLVKGRVTHLFTDIYCDLTTTNRLKLDEFVPLIPDSMKVALAGWAEGSIRSKFRLSQLKKMQLERMKISGSQTLTDFYAAYDSISLNTDRSKIDFALPNYSASTADTKFAFVGISSVNLSASKLESYQASLSNASIRLQTSDLRDTTRIPDIICSFTMDSLTAGMDTLSVAISRPDGEIFLFPRYKKPAQPRILFSYNSGQFKTIMGQDSVCVKDISLETDVQNDKTQDDIFLKWEVKGFVDMNEGSVSYSSIPYPVEIPSIKMEFDPENFSIEEASMKIDKSDFKLSGVASNILSYFRGDSILRGSFSFLSDTTDIGQLMALTSGLGTEDTLTVEQVDESGSDSSYTGPYMVPEGMDLLLHTNIKNAVLGKDTATNIKGDVRVKDGVLLLDGLTLKTPATRIQLTSMYRTPRKNHIYIGLDYHMLDIEISELLNMIPDIDTLMPMLRSFAGEAEFHIAIETYMDSLYNIKKSTLRGASSIRGNDLVLMDSETFSEMASKLKFSKKTKNKVDSLSVEFTIFRNEIDIYPFLIVMDKYKAVVAGRHNFDMSFSYHVSLVESPVPIKLGVDLKGDLEDMNVDLAKCRYAEFYRPARRGVVENKQLELIQMIRDILTQKVKLTE